MAKKKPNPKPAHKEVVNPRIDIIFKKLFGIPANTDLLISLLNSIVSEADQVDEIELLNPYNERRFKKDKLSIVDVEARNKHDRTHFLIEMQLADETDYYKRGLYTWARVYSDQLGKGVTYPALRKTIAIHLLNFTLIHYENEAGWQHSMPNKYHHRFILCDEETKVHQFKDIEIHTIELNKFESQDPHGVSEILKKVQSALDRWATFLTRYHFFDDVDTLPREIDTPEIKKALDIVQEMHLSPVEREVYESHLAFLRMESSAFDKKFLDGRQDGIIEGRAEGEKIGEERGIEKGIKIGEQRGIEKEKKIVQSMLSDGEPIERIMRYTGLSAEEIERL